MKESIITEPKPKCWTIELLNKFKSKKEFLYIKNHLSSSIETNGILNRLLCSQFFL